MDNPIQQLVHDFLKHLSERNITALTQLFAEKVDWYIPGDQEKAAWLGTRTNRQEIVDFFDLLWKNTEPVAATIDNILSDEAHAVITGEFSTKMLPTNKIVHSLFCIHMQVRDHKIVRYRLLEDSFAVSQSLSAD